VARHRGRIGADGKQSMTSSKNLASFVWSIADQLRGVYKPAQYGSVILPLTTLRRMDCVLEPVKAGVLAEAAKIANRDRLDFVVRKKFGVHYFNTSVWDFAKLVADPTGLKANLVDYVNRFSPNVADIFERYKFENQIATLDEKDRLFLVVQKFAEIDLHPDVVSNADMGMLFEELIRKFAEASNETAGEHFTPRDAIRLMVDLLFAADDEALSMGAAVRSVYDPTAGTGGMLSVAEEHLIGTEDSPGLNPAASLTLYGQEINDESYAICKSDLVGKGQDAGNIQLGDTLRDDKFAGQTFDYCMSNPPYGFDWKAAHADVTAEVAKLGERGRFGHGLPSVSDGQMLFLCHLASKMRPLKDGGGRAGIVLNGSPLFTGRAGSGESEIRRSLLESDLVDAIVALPTDMFYNTGIATYIWILDNDKPSERLGKVQLIDATSFWSKMRKSLGSKRREMTEANRSDVVKLYDASEDHEQSRTFPTECFGYRTITVERPLRLNFDANEERIGRVLEAKAVAKLSIGEQYLLREALTSIGSGVHRSRKSFNALLGKALGEHDLAYDTPVRKAILSGLSERDETAEICTDSKGNPEPDTTLRDTENVPLAENVEEHFEREVKPHVPDAWIDHSKTKIGYEIPFTRVFYRYVPPRPLDEIDADLNRLVGEIIALLQDVER
jgi:type I restriction enzyme M protein